VEITEIIEASHKFNRRESRLLGGLCEVKGENGRNNIEIEKIICIFSYSQVSSHSSIVSKGTTPPQPPQVNVSQEPVSGS